MSPSSFPFIPGIIKGGVIIKRLIFICLLPLAAGLYAETDVVFQDFPWGTSIETFTAKMGKPAAREKVDGMDSLVYENIMVGEYTTYMVVYFSKAGLEGGTYYFITEDLDDLMQCYLATQKQLLDEYGPTTLRDGIIRERRPYETSWNLAGGYVYLKVNTRLNEPVTLWYSSPALTKKLLGAEARASL